MNIVFFYCTRSDCSRPNCPYHEAVIISDFIEIESLPMQCKPVKLFDLYVVKVRHSDENSIDFPWQKPDGQFELVQVHAYRKVRNSDKSFYLEIIRGNTLRSVRGMWQRGTFSGKDCYVSYNAELLEE